MASRTCRCNSVVGRLIRQITPYLQALNIFDTGNVFVYCLECSIFRRQNQCPEIIVTPISVHGCVVDKPGIYIVVGNPSLGSQCKQNQNQTCQTNSTIIHIGSSNNLLRRFAYFISELKDDFCEKLHSTAHRIRRAILKAYTSQTNTCLYIIGLPLKPQNNQQEEVERCFQEVFINSYEDLPCCIKQPANAKPNFNVFGTPNLQQTIQTIQDLLKDIDNIFNNCIQHC